MKRILILIETILIVCVFTGCIQSLKIDMSNPINAIIVEKAAEQLGIDKIKVKKDSLAEITKLFLYERDLTDNNLELTGEYNLDILSYMTNLQELNLYDIECENYDFLKDMLNLNRIWISSSGNDKSITFKQYKNLEVINLIGFNNIDIKSIEELEKLKYLSLYNCNIENMSFIANIKGLETLILRDYDNIEFLSEMTDIQNMTVLWLSGEQITDITPIRNCKNLTSLRLNDTNITDITPISSLIKLENLDLSNTKINDISSLETLNNLKSLNLEDTKIDRINCVSNMNKLDRLILRNTNVSDMLPIVEASPNYMDLDIRGTNVTTLKVLQDYNGKSIYIYLDREKIVDIDLIENKDNIFIVKGSYIG